MFPNYGFVYVEYVLHVHLRLLSKLRSVSGGTFRPRTKKKLES